MHQNIHLISAFAFAGAAQAASDCEAKAVSKDGKPLAGAAKSSASVQSVDELISAVLQGHTAGPEAGRTLANAARSGAAATAGAGKASAGAPSVGELIGGLLQRHAAPRPSTRPTTNAQPTASAADISADMQPATDTLSTLVAPLFLRPLSNTGAAPAEAGPQRASERLPLLRAPSRLLGAAAPGTQAAAAAAATAKVRTAAAEPASGQPAFGQPADGPAELAAELDRLLREQAWLRGVDLT